MAADRSGFCVTCQKRVENRYDHKKRYVGHTINRDTAPIDAAEQAESQATADDVLSAATEEQAGKSPAKKVSGADFLSQPLFVATAGVGLGWITARAFGPENALKQEEAYGIAAGALRIAGRHFLKNVDMTALSEANGDINDALLIVRSMANYIARRWTERADRKASESPAQQSPMPMSPEPERSAPTAYQNGRVNQVEQEASFMQQQMAAFAMNAPYMGQEAA